MKKSPRRGQCTGNAYSNEDHQCPSETGITWRYGSGSSWMDAGGGLLISCYHSNCSADVPCQYGEGDCNDDAECAGLYVCGVDNCENGPRGVDCCTSTCHNDTDCVNQECNLNTSMCRLHSYSTDWSKCNQDSPCTNGDGDCDDHTDCEGALFCGNDNCAGLTIGMDCCEKSE